MQQRNSLFENQVDRPYEPSLFETITRKERRKSKQPSKKEKILILYKSGKTDLEELAQEVGSKPSYVATVLQAAGFIHNYFDLYTTTANEQNVYSKFFRNVLSFKSLEAAKESIQRIDTLYRYFERIGDRAGQHHAQVVALTGRNRARWSGKKEEAHIFEEWLLKT